MHKIPVYIIPRNKKEDRAGVPAPVAVTLELPLPQEEEGCEPDKKDSGETCITFRMDMG